MRVALVAALLVLVRERLSSEERHFIERYGQSSREAVNSRKTIVQTLGVAKISKGQEHILGDYRERITCSCLPHSGRVGGDRKQWEDIATRQ